jgi:hypothetical protein
MIRAYKIRAPRVDVVALVEFWSCGKVYRGFSIDLSDGGIHSQICGFLEVGELGTIVLHAPGGDWERSAEVVSSTLGDVRFRFLSRRARDTGPCLSVVPFEYGG